MPATNAARGKALFPQLFEAVSSPARQIAVSKLVTVVSGSTTGPVPHSGSRLMAHGEGRHLLMLARRLFWSSLLIAFMMASAPHSSVPLSETNDKLQHLVAFFVLASLAGLAYPQLSLFVLFLGLAGFGASIEFIQALPAIERDPDWLDWLADLAGAGLALILIGGLRAIVGTRGH